MFIDVPLVYVFINVPHVYVFVDVHLIHVLVPFVPHSSCWYSAC